MAHSRPRHVLKLIKKRLQGLPVLALQGARQTGKSFLARELLSHDLERSRYLTLDTLVFKQAANASPDSFLLEYEDAKPLMIDEAQKAPPLFDAIKKQADDLKRPGRYLLLGSTEFSRQVLIRESLTGRLSRVRVYPFDLAETIGLDVVQKDSVVAFRKHLLKYLTFGGLPGICFCREDKQREQLFEDWLGLICFRDLQQFKGMQLDGEVASLIMRELAQCPEPTLAQVSKNLRLDSRKVAKHLLALEQLFVVTRLLPHPSGTGKPWHMLFDVGLANHLGASFERRLHIWLMNEQFSYESYFGAKRVQFYYYRSSGKKVIHLIRETMDRKLTAFQIINFENYAYADSELMHVFLTKNSGKAVGFVLTPATEKTIINTVSFAPWETGCRFLFGA